MEFYLLLHLIKLFIRQEGKLFANLWMVKLLQKLSPRQRNVAEVYDQKRTDERGIHLSLETFNR